MTAQLIEAIADLLEAIEMYRTLTPAPGGEAGGAAVDAFVQTLQPEIDRLRNLIEPPMSNEMDKPSEPELELFRHREVEIHDPTELEEEMRGRGLDAEMKAFLHNYAAAVRAYPWPPEPEGERSDAAYDAFLRAMHAYLGRVRKGKPAASGIARLTRMIQLDLAYLRAQIRSGPSR